MRLQSTQDHHIRTPFPQLPAHRSSLSMLVLSGHARGNLSWQICCWDRGLPIDWSLLTINRRRSFRGSTIAREGSISG
jgi:hypothetical protein